MTPTPARVAEAAARVAGHVRRTPVMTCSTLDALAGRAVTFKCENLQTTGSFKFRGATNAVRALPDEVARRGVVAHSSGNHAQALALAARQRGIPAYLVMPHTAAAVKRDAVLGYGGLVTDCEPTLAARERAAAEVVARTGGTLIPPFDHVDVIAGQGTAALELLTDHPDLDALIAPVGGGGMLAGFCLAAQLAHEQGITANKVRVFGAEPVVAGDAALSLARGERQPAMPPTSVADGLLTSLGELTWPIIRREVGAIYTVTEAEILAAMRLVWERMKLVVEPSAAVGVAAVLAEPFRRLPGLGLGRVGVVLCGGNVGLDRLAWAAPLA